jgi:hypothetical protein
MAFPGIADWLDHQLVKYIQTTAQNEYLWEWAPVLRKLTLENKIMLVN